MSLGGAGLTAMNVDGLTEARRRFESLAMATPEVDLSRLPKDELGLRRSGLAGYDGGPRYHPSDMSLYEVRLPSNDRLGRSGHINIASPSKEAVEVEYTPGAAGPAASESDTEVSLFDGGRGGKGVRVETRELVGGGTLKILSGPNLNVYHLELPGKILYAEQSATGSLLISAHQLEPNTPWITNRLQTA